MVALARKLTELRQVELKSIPPLVFPEHSPNILP